MNRFKDIEQYFKKDEWKELNDFQKQRFLNIKTIYDQMNDLGFEPNLPDFMKPRKRCKTPEPSSTDEEWSWRSEKSPVKKKKLVHFKPKKVNKDKHVEETKPKPSKIKTKSQPINETQMVALLFEEYPDGFELENIDSTEEEAKRVKNMIKGLKNRLTRALKANPDLILDENPTRKNPERNQARSINYVEPDIPDDDDYLLCDDCNEYYEGDCPIHGPLIIIPNKDVVADGSDPFRAIHSIPASLKLAASTIPGAGLGIFAVDVIVRNSRFGPYEGVDVQEINQQSYVNGYCWQIFKNGKKDHYVDAVDIAKSNWLRYVNCACVENQQNLMAFQYKGNIYYRTYKKILPGEELMVWYGDKYATDLGIMKKYGKVNYQQDLMNKSLVHTVDKRFKCYKCKFTAMYKSHLNRHVRIHSGEKPFKCEKCDYAAARKSHLNRHVLVHTGEKPFKCEKCDYAAIQKSNLDTHVLVHTGEKPFKCEKCDYAATQKSNLNTHVLVHTGEKPFKCEKCDYAAAVKINFNRHVRIHHGGKTF